MTEYDLHKSLAEYLRLQYPAVIFISHMAGVRLPVGLATKMAALQSGRGFPDLYLLEPRLHYHGATFELKTSRDEIFRRNGELRQERHIQEQAAMLEELNRRGYFATWGPGFDETRALIDVYLNSGER